MDNSPRTIKPPSEDQAGRNGRVFARLLPLLTLLSLAALGWVAVMAWHVGRVELLMIEPRHQIARWQRGLEKPGDQDWQMMHAKVSRALQLTPGNASVHDFMGALYAIKGKEQWTDPVARRRFFSLAKSHQEESLALRVTSSRTWASLAASDAALGQADEKIFHALTQAIYFGPHDAATQRLVFAVLISRWPQAPDTLKRWARALYQSAQMRGRLSLDKVLKDAGQTPELLR